MPESRLRLSELVVQSPRQTPEEIGRRLGVPADETDGNCWLIRTTGDDATVIDSMTGAVLARLSASWQTLEAIAAEGGVRIVLRVVAYLSPADRMGGGISFDALQLQRLASIGAVLDLDLYSVE